MKILDLNNGWSDKGMEKVRKSDDELTRELLEMRLDVPNTRFPSVKTKYEVLAHKARINPAYRR